MEKISLCPLAEIEDGASRGFDPFGTGRDALFVVRQGEGVVAWRNACPHQGYEGASMPWRKHAYLNADSSRIVCAGHGAQFDIHTGSSLSGPCAGQTLEKMTVQLDGDGVLYWVTNKLS